MLLADWAALPTGLGLVAMLLLLVVRTLSHGMILQRIKRRYADDWHGIGSPRIFESSDISNLLRLGKYVRTKQYEGHNDRWLSGWIFLWKWSGRIGITTACLVFLSLFFH